MDEVSEVVVLQDIVEITVDSGSRHKRMANAEEARHENEADEDGEDGCSEWQSDAY